MPWLPTLALNVCRLTGGLLAVGTDVASNSFEGQEGAQDLLYAIGWLECVAQP